MVDVLKLLQDYQIPHTTTHHHCTPGWVNVHCPFCPGKQNFHLGINLTTQACHCWRCGPHSFIDVVSALLTVDRKEAVRIIREYTSPVAVVRKRVKKRVFRPQRKSVVLPDGLLNDLLPEHVRYLQSRGFDPDNLKQLWHIRSFNWFCRYKHRIFIPIEYEKKVVSYQCRATLPQIHPRYLTARKEHEVIHHKYILYGIDYVQDTVVVVEGPTDVLRIGPGAVATFGLQYTLPQVILLSSFRKVYIMFDNEPQAQRVARKLAYEIELAGDTTVYTIEDYGADDPGSLSHEDVVELRYNVFQEEGYAANDKN